MRIEKLRLKNFAPIYYSLDKEEVFLDYTTDEMRGKTIFIFVGKMGSCKTFLLGHHQPFATLGTLDARNGEDLVLPGKRGIKEITYTHGKDVFEILHVFTPSGDNSHTVKSYMKKNGNELNPNGNGNSFKTLVELEFGLEQNYLKLFRIGANVVNLPDMSSSERKTFISSMLSETEVYTMLFRRLGEKGRAVAAQMSMLLNRIRSISNRSEEDLEKELKLEEELLAEVSEQYGNLQKEQYRLEGEISAISGNTSLDDKMKLKREMESTLTSLEEHYASNLADLEAADKLPNPTKLSNQLAATKSRIQMRNEAIIKRSSELDRLSADLNKLRDKLATMASAEQVEILKKTYQGLMVTRDDYMKQLKNFNYSGTAATIDTIIANSQLMNELIARVAQYSPELIRAFFSNPGKAIYSAKRKTEELERELGNAQQEMDNMRAASTYVPTYVMTRPPMCPTKDCPFYAHHPYTESRKASGVKLDQRYIDARNKIQAIKTKMLTYQDYPTIGNQISSVKNAWNRVMQQMQELGLLIEEDLQEIIINPTKRHWFDMERANRIRELCGIREKYYELTQRVKSMQDEIAVYEISDRDALEKERDRLAAQVAKLSAELESLEAENEKDKASEGELSENLSKVMMLETIRAHTKTLEQDIEAMKQKIEELDANITKLSAHYHNMAVIKSQIASKREEFTVHDQSCNDLRRKISDMQYCRVQYDEAKIQYDVLRDILEATNSKNGIPLAFVKLFLADCKDIINDLIQDVFQDHIELQEFYIPADAPEFYIPYSKNGKVIQDVNKASQGERAIISMALSFALIRQATFLYNIMLLDEMDGPLYREDRNKFITILLKQVQAMHAEQVFLVSHNNTFDGFNVGIIMTTEENIDESPLTSVIRV